MKLMIAKKGVDIYVRPKGLGNPEEFEHLNDSVRGKLVKLDIVTVKNHGQAIGAREPKPSFKNSLKTTSPPS